MARVLLGEKWFDEVSARSLYEADYQAILKRLADKMFPEFFLVRFEQRVTSPYGNADPDFALVSRQYRSWWVVEAEMADHSLKDHVIPQVRVFQLGHYRSDHVEALMAEFPAFDRSKLEPLVNYTPPRVLVIVNRPMPEWRSVLAHFDTSVSVVEVFRSRDNSFAFRVNGDIPTDVDVVESAVGPDPLVPRLLRVANAAVFGSSGDDLIEILLDGAVTKWRIQRLGGGLYLVPEGRFPLDPSKSYLIRRSGDRLEFASKEG